jgi:hypothetical protein
MALSQAPWAYIKFLVSERVSPYQMAKLGRGKKPDIDTIDLQSRKILSIEI